MRGNALLACIAIAVLSVADGQAVTNIVLQQNVGAYWCATNLACLTHCRTVRAGYTAALGAPNIWVPLAKYGLVYNMTTNDLNSFAPHPNG